MSETNEPDHADNAAALFAAIQAGDSTVVSELLARDGAVSAACNEQGVAALMWALYHRQQGIADAIAAQRTKIGAGLTLHEAASMGQQDTVREHLKGGGDLGGLSIDGFTPLHFAAFFSREEVVPLLLENGAQVAVPAHNPSAVHPLHSAAAIGSVEICRQLLEKGAVVDAQQHGGFTALMSAALHGNLELVQLLLEHGADVSIESDEGKTAASMASDGKHAAVVERLAK